MFLLFIYIYTHVLVHSYFAQWVKNPLLWLFILMLILAHGWSARVPSSWLLCSFDVVISCLNFLNFWPDKILWVHVTFSLPQTWNQPFLQGSLVPINGQGYLEINIWTLGVEQHILNMYNLTEQYLYRTTLFKCPTWF